MSNELMLVLLFGFMFLTFFVGMPAIFYFYSRKASRIGEVWRQFASAHDLEYEERGMMSWPFSLEGTWNGVGVQVLHAAEHNPQHGSGPKFTKYGASLPPGAPEVHLSVDDSMLTSGRIESGDEVFDDTFQVDGDDPEAVYSFLKPKEVRETLVGLEKRGCSPSIEASIIDGESYLYIRHDELAEDEETLAEHLDLIADSGRTIRSTLPAASD